MARPDVLGGLSANLRAKFNIPTVTQWIEDQTILTDMGVPFELHDRNFMREILDDMHPLQCQIKCAQVGLSVGMGIKALHHAAFHNMNIIYTMPTTEMVRTHVTTKINPIMENNKVMHPWKREEDTKGMKKVGDRFILFLGTWSGTDAVSHSSDLNIHDELDPSNPKTIQTFESRTLASDYDGHHFFSNPTYPGAGVDKMYGESDQRHWFIKCEKCGEWQFMDWPDSVCRKHQQFQCKKCKKHISDDVRRNGHWVPKWQSRKDDMHGYWISHLFMPWRSAKQLIHASKNTERDYFHNMILGKPYQGSEMKVTRESLAKCVAPEDTTVEAPLFMGVDQGRHEKHVIIGNLYGVSEITIVRDWFEEDANGSPCIESIIRRKDPQCVVIDALPDTLSVEKLQKKFPGKVFMNFYQLDAKSPESHKWDDVTGVFQTARNRYIDDMIADIVERKMLFMDGIEKKPMFEEYMKHWETLYMTMKTDKLGNERRVWESANNIDHFVHATLYYRLAVSRYLKYTGGGDDTRGITYLDEENERPLIDQIELESRENDNMGQDWLAM